MMEKEVKVSARPKDLDLVKTAAKEAAAQFEKEAGFAVKVEVDGELAAGGFVDQTYDTLYSKTDI